MQSSGLVIFALLYFGLFGGMALWPAKFYSVSKAKGMISNGPLLMRIIGIIMLGLPLVSVYLVKVVE